MIAICCIRCTRSHTRQNGVKYNCGPNMTIHGAAVIGQLNNPLYLSSFTSAADDEAIKLHTILHCSLDAIDEKVLNVGRALPADAGDGYIGLLYVVDDLKVYGYITKTKIKFLVVIDDPVVKDDELRAIFRRFHTAFIDAVSNPFYTPNTAMTSKRFDASIRTIATSLGALV